MANTPSRAVMLFGTDEPVAPMRRLQAGPLTAELDSGNLRYIRLAGVEAIRAVSFIVRDRNWGTYNPAIDNLSIDEGAHGFVVTYDATCRDDAQEYRYRARIEGRPDGRLAFTAEGRAVTDFTTNRTGFVVLHPIAGVSGRPVEVLHVDGSTEQAVFPDLIDPVQPFKDIRALTHEVLPGVRVTCRMEGDTFEMEDQRNWTDASYKTYVRPLALPWPYTLRAGETATQSVTLTVEGRLAARPAGAARAPVEVRVGDKAGAMPRIGLGLEAQHAEAALGVADAIRAAGPQILVCTFDLGAGHDAAVMEGFRRLGQATGAMVGIEAILPCREDVRTELGRIAEAARTAGLRPAAVAVSPAADLKSTLPGSKWPDVPPLEDIYEAAREAFPGVLLGGGMFSYFTELNRKRPPADRLDFVTHTTCATVHAGDDVTVTETLEALPAVIRSTRAFIGSKGYGLGPSAIGMRHNPYGAAPADNPNNGRRAMARIDPRQRGLLGAAWNLGYAAHAARGGIDTVVLSAPVGEFGIVYARMGWAQPWFDEIGRGVYPVYHVIAGLAAAAGDPLLATDISAGREVQAVAHASGGTTTLWLANLTGESQEVAVSGLPAPEGTLRLLDESTFVACATAIDGFAGTARSAPLDRVVLGPYAVARLDAARA